MARFYKSDVTFDRSNFKSALSANRYEYCQFAVCICFVETWHSLPTLVYLLACNNNPFHPTNQVVYIYLANYLTNISPSSDGTRCTIIIRQAMSSIERGERLTWNREWRYGYYQRATKTAVFTYFLFTTTVLELGRGGR